MSNDIPKDLEHTYQRLMSIMLNQAPIAGVEELVDPKVKGYGTTSDEEIHNLDEFIALIRRQENEAKEAGLEFNFDRTLIHKMVSLKEDTALFIEQIKVTYRVEAQFREFIFRFSAVMEYSGLGWKLIHWHGSIPSDIENDTWHLNEWKAEKEKLEKLVAEQTSDLQQKNRALEIEASTQRVRTAAMSMQKPDDIMNVLNVIKEEVEKFELKNIGTWFWIFNDDHTLTQWDISEIDLNGTLANVNITLDLEKSESSKRHIPKWNSVDYYTMPSKGKELLDLIGEVKELDPKSGEMFQEAVDSGRMETYWQACAPFSKGVLGLDYTYEPPEAVKPILTKMALAFDMAYQRFEDLQKAEKRRKEAELEASVERVRSHAMGMQTSDDLMVVLQTLHEEFQKLDLPAHLSTHIVIEKDLNYVEAFNIGNYDLNQGTAYQTEVIDLRQLPLFKYLVEGWRLNPFYHVAYVSREKIIEHGDNLRQIKDYNHYADIWNNADLKELWNVSAGFGVGLLGGDFLLEPDDWVKEVLTKMANAFGMAYQRFKELQVKEEQAQAILAEKERLSVALQELHNTQDQLIQQEKLASLGQLTAGIAHEIQNPLNFVNNFSEVSKELLEEMLEELQNGDMEEINAIAKDVIENLEKINHHGKRADGIVKGMLQHSRSSSGTKEDTDINVLVDEYLRLAYHGLRAKDKSFNAALETHLDDSIDNINIVPQDIGRVVLNLITNAFDAVTEKKKQQPENYEPTVTVSTKKLNNELYISVEDNGNGIPKAIIDKIFQPFFTTKPTGQGTGLGLSLSYDIVKAHGGALKVETKSIENLQEQTEVTTGTKFIIQLPLK